MYFGGTVVIFAAPFPHPIIRNTICSLDIKHQILNKVDLIGGENDLKKWEQIYVPVYVASQKNPRIVATK